MGKIILETKRLILREYEESDFPDLFKIICDEETMKYYPRPYDSDGVRRWISWCKDSYLKNGFGLWAIILKETKQFIGDCGISLQNIDGVLSPEIGYHINKNYWRNGYASEAGIAVRDYGFKELNLKELYSYMNYDNIPSYSTALKIGMTNIKDYYDGKEKLRVYRITKEEWEKYEGNRIL